MAWLAVNRDKTEVILGGCKKPSREFMKGLWWSPTKCGNLLWNKSVELPKGTIKKLIGRELTWKDEPVELK